MSDSTRMIAKTPGTAMRARRMASSSGSTPPSARTRYEAEASSSSSRSSRSRIAWGTRPSDSDRRSSRTKARSMCALLTLNAELSVR